MQEKAERLVLSGAVRMWSNTPQRLAATVKGDHGTYRVVGSADTVLTCTCQAAGFRVRCSHITAVELLLRSANQQDDHHDHEDQQQHAATDEDAVRQ